MSDATKPEAPSLDRMPLLAAALDRKGDRFRKRLADMAGHLAAGFIPNARFEDLRPGIMDGLSDGWNAGVPEALDGIARPTIESQAHFEDGTVERAAMVLRQELRLSSYEGLKAVDRLAAKLEKAMAGTHPPAIAAALAEGPARLAEIKAVADAMSWLRDRRMKRAPPGSAPPAPVLPPATLKAQAAVRAKMREVTDELRGAYVERVAEYVRGRAEAFEGACAKLAKRVEEVRQAREDDRRAGRPMDFREPADVDRMRQFVHALRIEAEPLVDLDFRTYATKRHPDGEARLAEFAKAETERVFGLWTNRNVSKLAPILEAKGGAEIVVESATASSQGVETEMSVRLPDGAHFGFSNGIVESVSSQGTWFLQFPARFHAAFRADGTRIRGPSEAVVKREYGAAPDAAPSVEAEAPRMR